MDTRKGPAKTRAKPAVASRRKAVAPVSVAAPAALLADLRQLIQQARQVAAVNISLTMLYWQVGQRIQREVLGSERADYGEQIVATVSRQLPCEQ